MRERKRVPVEQPPEHISELSMATSLGSPPVNIIWVPVYIQYTPTKIQDFW
jgi:hypothetical protein